jgi:putative hemolysin
LAEPNPTFDLYPLGKLLWSMVSGRPELHLWYWKDEENNLEVLFPGVPGMDWINSRILPHFVVEREESCKESARELHGRVKAVLALLEQGVERVARPKRSCRVCGVGHYIDPRGTELQFIGMLNEKQAKALTQAEFIYKQGGQRMTVRVQTCDSCGHVELFNFPDGDTPPAWASSSKESRE